MTTDTIARKTQTRQPCNLYLYDDVDATEFIQDFPSMRTAREYARHWVVKHGEEAYAEITDPEDQRVLDKITYEDALAYLNALLCECGCGREQAAGFQGCASRECCERAFMGGQNGR